MSFQEKVRRRRGLPYGEVLPAATTRVSIRAVKGKMTSVLPENSLLKEILANEADEVEAAALLAKSETWELALRADMHSVSDRAAARGGVRLHSDDSSR